jgi:hypothetical protein
MSQDIYSEGGQSNGLVAQYHQAVLLHQMFATYYRRRCMVITSLAAVQQQPR